MKTSNINIEMNLITDGGEHFIISAKARRGFIYKDLTVLRISLNKDRARLIDFADKRPSLNIFSIKCTNGIEEKYNKLCHGDAIHIPTDMKDISDFIDIIFRTPNGFLNEQTEFILAAIDRQSISDLHMLMNML